MTRTATPKQQTSSHEVVVALRDCKAGEQIVATFSEPVSAWLYSDRNYRAHCKDRKAPVIGNCGCQIDAHHCEYTATFDGDWYLVVEPRGNGLPLPEVTVERRPVDPVLWNDAHGESKIVRKQPTPFDAPMASTVGYWERKTAFTIPQLWACHVCNGFLPRDEARCALVTVVGELPRKDYVLPICPHCYATADGRTFMARPTLLAPAPKA